jgi:glycerate-2-kinase
MSRILNAETLTNHGHLAGRQMLLDILETGMRAADPYYAMRALLRLEGNTLHVGGSIYVAPQTPMPATEVIDLQEVRRIFVVGAGKGVTRAALALEELLGERLTGGELIDKHETPHELQRIQVTFGAHPVPDEGCAEGCRRILALAEDLGPDDLVFTLMGNGTGSLFTLPVEGLSIEDIRKVVYAFQIEKGGPTVDLIPIRNQLDQVKGGRITRALAKARVVHLIAFYRPASYADMVGGRFYRWLHVLPDESTAADAIASLKKWELWEETDPVVRDYLARANQSHAQGQGHSNSTLRVQEFEALHHPVFFLFPPELGMIPTAKKRAQELGIPARILFNNYTFKSEAAQAGRFVANLALHSEVDGEPFQPPCALISGGELIVTVGRETGMGGRNQEYIVSAALELAGTKHVVMASVDSDGTDGPGRQFVQGEAYDAIPVLTGGIVDGTTVAHAAELGINLTDALKRHDTSPALYALGDGVVARAGMSMGDLSVTLILDQQPKAMSGYTQVLTGQPIKPSPNP